MAKTVIVLKGLWNMILENEYTSLMLLNCLEIRIYQEKNVFQLHLVMSYVNKE